jgi:hypothetical protein
MEELKARVSRKLFQLGAIRFGSFKLKLAREATPRAVVADLLDAPCRGSSQEHLPRSVGPTDQRPGNRPAELLAPPF